MKIELEATKRIGEVSITTSVKADLPDTAMFAEVREVFAFFLRAIGEEKAVTAS